MSAGAPTTMDRISPLAAWQRAFHHDLTSDEPRSPLAAHPGFAVHRATSARAGIDAIEANFPAVACLVGRDWLRSAAAAYVAGHPPVDARLMMFGGDFPAFLATAPAASELPYLGDVARLDRLWTESYAATDAPALRIEAIQGMAPEALGALRVVAHPATRWLASPLPAHAIWMASRAGEVVADDLAWLPQATLFCRPGHTVVASAADPAVITFLQACHAGASLASCIDHVTHAHPTAPADRVFAQLLTTGALTAA
jgi:hypothetical protein